MSKQPTLIVSLLATTLMMSGAVIAAGNAAQPNQVSQQQATAEKDARKLSVDGARAYQDVAMARLAIFDGRTDEAKKQINDAVTLFGKAKNDASVFTKAEADLKLPNRNGGQAANKPESGAQGEANKPIAWLPVDGEILLDEDFSGNAKKTAAASEANKNLAKGDRAGAIEKLKLADINIDYVFALVPVDETMTDVQQAAKMVNEGKYFEASQKLRAVQASTRFDVLDIEGMPKSGSAKPAPATDASKPTH